MTMADALPRSLHRRILGEIEDNIVSGRWPPGHRVPFEHELTALYGCSRMTVSKVLTQLANAGLVLRRRKAGTFVMRPHSRAAVLEINDIGAEVAALGPPYRFEILSRNKRKSRKSDMPALELATPQPLLELHCRHFAGPSPFCIEERLINLAAVPEAADETFAAQPPGTWLVARVPWMTAEHRIRATGAGGTVAALLDIPAGTPCLAVERRTWNAERPITFVRLTYPGDAHELVARFTPARG